MGLFQAIVWDTDPVMINLFDKISIRYYSLLFAGGIFFGYSIVKKIMLREGYKLEEIEKLVFYIIIAIVVGSRLGHCLFYEPEYYLKHPLEMLLPIKFVNGSLTVTGFHGLASHGGILAVIFAVWLFCKRYAKSMFAIADKVVIGGSLTGACIRLGNFMNSEILGKPTGTDSGVIFKLVDDVIRHPAQLYESIAYLFLFALLFFLYKNENIRARKGFLFGLFLSLLFLARFFIEYFKINQVDFEEGMMFNMGQLLSVPFIIIGMGLMIWRWKKGATITEKPKV